jgi:hypothetical protein
MSEIQTKLIQVLVVGFPPQQKEGFYFYDLGARVGHIKSEEVLRCTSYVPYPVIYIYVSRTEGVPFKEIFGRL